jgi:hypothetical protein
VGGPPYGGSRARLQRGRVLERTQSKSMRTGRKATGPEPVDIGGNAVIPPPSTYHGPSSLDGLEAAKPEVGPVTDSDRTFDRIRKPQFEAEANVQPWRRLASAAPPPKARPTA